MASDTWSRVDGGTDTEGKIWAVGHCGPLVLLAVDPTATVLRFDGEQRDQFIKAYAEAERQAEANEAAVTGG